MKSIINKVIYKPLLKKRKYYYSKSHYYRKSMGLYDDIDNLCKLFIIDKEKHSTNKYILLSTNIEFGSTLKQVKKKLGKPACSMERQVNSLNFKVMQYKMYLGGYKTKQEIHFYNNKLYYFSYTFPYMNEKDKKIIKDILCKKYMDKNCQLENKAMIDKNGNMIFISENVDFTINYLTGNELIIKTFEDIKSAKDKIKELEKGRYEKELLTKL